MLAMLRFEASEQDATFVEEAVTALRLLAARPGFRSGQLVRAYDQPSLWCLVTEWESVGAYRRAVGSYDVRSVATPLLSRALSEPSAFEPLAAAETGDDGATVRLRDSDRSIGSRA